MALAADRLHPPQAIDVATDEMTAEAISQAQGRLKIDGCAAAGPLPQGGAGQGLGADISFKAVLQQLSRREANPINGDAVANS